MTPLSLFYTHRVRTSSKVHGKNDITVEWAAMRIECARPILARCALCARLCFRIYTILTLFAKSCLVIDVN